MEKQIYKLFYSKKQEEMCKLLDELKYKKIYGILESGEIVQYTEMMPKGHSNWNDAVFLGYGYFHKLE